jgi:hypothetical protein
MGAVAAGHFSGSSESREQIRYKKFSPKDWRLPVKPCPDFFGLSLIDA